MRMSTKGRYGLRLMIDLAMNYEKGLVFLKDISKRQDISQKYLWQIIAPLKSAGLVVSGRGVSGGYSLTRSPETINLREILEVLEGSLMPVECIDNSKSCKRSSKCVAQDLWEELGTMINKKLEAISLQDMVLRQIRKFGGDTASMYYI